MHKRGYRLVLDPDRFDKHALLVAKLLKRGGWTEIDLTKSDLNLNNLETGIKPPVKDEDVLLPHQARALDNLKAIGDSHARRRNR